jgi:hypothetical protein
MHIDDGAVGERVREDRERARVPSELHLASRQRMPRLVVPQIPRDPAGQPKPAGRLVAAAGFPEGLKCLLEGPDGGGVPLGEADHQAVEQKVDQSGRSWCRGPRSDRLRNLGSGAAYAEAAAEDCCCERLEICLTREPGLERLESPRSPEQKLRGLAAASQGECELRAQPLPTGELQVVERPNLRRNKEPQSCAGVAGFMLGRCRRERTLRPSPRVGRKQSRLLQKRCGGGESPAGPRPGRGAFQRPGNLLVGSFRSVCAMPGAAIGIGCGIGGRSESSMDSSPFAGRRRAVDGRTQ